MAPASNHTQDVPSPVAPAPAANPVPSPPVVIPLQPQASSVDPEEEAETALMYMHTCYPSDDAHGIALAKVAKVKKTCIAWALAAHIPDLIDDDDYMRFMTTPGPHKYRDVEERFSM